MRPPVDTDSARVSNTNPTGIGGQLLIRDQIAGKAIQARAAHHEKWGMHVSKLFLASASRSAPTAQWAHDIRNALATIGLHLETLERLSGSRGREIALAAHDLMSRTAAMCSAAMLQGDRPDISNRRRGFDISKAIVQVANLLRSTAPQGFEIRVAGNGAFIVVADAQDVFRIIFNLVHNALGIARHQADGARMTNVTLLIERSGGIVTVRVADDGPGLPKPVRAKLFRRQEAPGGHGMGLAIARELAERNGGVLRLEDSARGTTFVLELIAPANQIAEGALRPLGKSIRH
jgi:signal transduction histidine kinase